MADMKKINSKKAFKIAIIAYAAVIVLGIIATLIFGLKLDINFAGGTRITYSYTGDVAQKDFEDTAKTVIKDEFKVSQSESFAGDTKTFVITVSGKKTVSAEKQNELSTALTKKFEKNNFEIYDANSVNASIAGSFFAKSLVAVLITAIFVVAYVGVRFRKIGGVSAALTALCALVLDLFVSFFVCAIFRLEIDSNYMAVVLTLLGYSLNDTIVVYDRVRENKKYYPKLAISENMDMTIGGILTRNIVTTTTTILAVLTIIVVSEIFGLTSLRTFAIPMAFGLVSGCFSSLFVAGPLWVLWKEYREKHMPAKKKKA